ncbi:hypothetical protein J7E24_04105 [Hymenobacter sp. ISL-91]|uniref:hypothetical protein n=1 Tax=Hymenobacter sp. ISL-91 TaxID=2819151 RepID=UPI001BE5E509|nr:hypothetical protein [Hymenobacter sp. ISL-91]MBT2556955.1 hypothetical protein [Hymenobacter sp. ISL-91]
MLKALSQELEVDKYQHEQISFEELFAASSIASRGQDNPLSGFKSKFDQLLATNAYPHSEDFTTKTGSAARGTSGGGNLESALVEDGADIYFPYSQDFEEIDNPTVTFAPLHNTQASTGYYYADTDGDGIEEIVEVTVDENYVQLHSTFIVQPLDESEMTTSTEQPIILQPNGTNSIKDTANELRIGYVQLTKQLDGLFGDGSGNSGGSELRFTRPKGYLSIDAGGQVDVNKEPAAIVGVDLSRATIRDKNHTYQYIIFDSDWTRLEKTQYFVVYEYDNASERTKTAKTTFEVNTGVTIPGKDGGPSGTVNTKTTKESTEEIKYKTKEEIIWQQDFARSLFFYANTLDQYNGWRGEFPFWKAQDYLKFTLPRRELIYDRY